MNPVSLDTCTPLYSIPQPLLMGGTTGHKEVQGAPLRGPLVCSKKASLPTTPAKK